MAGDSDGVVAVRVLSVGDEEAKPWAPPGECVGRWLQGNTREGEKNWERVRTGSARSAGNSTEPFINLLLLYFHITRVLLCSSQMCPLFSHFPLSRPVSLFLTHANSLVSLFYSHPFISLAQFWFMCWQMEAMFPKPLIVFTKVCLGGTFQQLDTVPVISAAYSSVWLSVEALLRPVRTRPLVQPTLEGSKIAPPDADGGSVQIFVSLGEG